MRAVARLVALLLTGAVAVALVSGCVGVLAPPPPTAKPIVQPTAQPTHADTDLPGALQPASSLHSPLVPITEPAVLRYCPNTSAQHFDQLVLAVEIVYICRADGHHQTDGVYTFGPWQSAVQVLDPAALLRAYSAPDAPQSTRACTAKVPPTDPLIIWVWHAGSGHAYRAPIDVCGYPQTGAAQNYAVASDGLDIVQVDVGSIGDPSSLPYPAEH